VSLGGRRSARLKPSCAAFARNLRCEGIFACRLLFLALQGLWQLEFGGTNPGAPASCAGRCAVHTAASFVGKRSIVLRRFDLAGSTIAARREVDVVWWQTCCFRRDPLFVLITIGAGLFHVPPASGQVLYQEPSRGPLGGIEIVRPPAPGVPNGGRSPISQPLPSRLDVSSDEIREIQSMCASIQNWDTLGICNRVRFLGR
jgi:hypothetical protein